ncbi:Gmad2 immunoglobulin-like domain-containing protein [Egicoccus sp. AB-alg6-2]|uniref:Gmad2 immunoglobulin-like domain-containing protein n=1 Tax=Egicoccus sp. AB-alg6-2 TaxID=3242692 RepID=UPI00359EE252
MRRPVLRSALFALALTLAACGDAGSEPSLTDPTEPADEQTEEPEPEPTEDATEDPEPEPTEDDVVTDEGDDDQAAEDPDDGDDPQTGADEPTADEAAIADPCADHQGREGEAFLEVVAPVDEQRIDDLDAVELVGCSNVYEATVQWELYDGDGRLLDEGFLTAECGSGCVGEFREDLDLSAAGGEPFAELHVFSENAGDGSQDYLTAIPLVPS